MIKGFRVSPEPGFPSKEASEKHRAIHRLHWAVRMSLRASMYGWVAKWARASFLKLLARKTRNFNFDTRVLFRLGSLSQESSGPRILQGLGSCSSHDLHTEKARHEYWIQDGFFVHCLRSWLSRGGFKVSSRNVEWYIEGGMVLTLIILK